MGQVDRNCTWARSPASWASVGSLGAKGFDVAAAGLDEHFVDGAHAGQFVEGSAGAVKAGDSSSPGDFIHERWGRAVLVACGAGRGFVELGWEDREDGVAEGTRGHGRDSNAEGEKTEAQNRNGKHISFIRDRYSPGNKKGVEFGEIIISIGA